MTRKHKRMRLERVRELKQEYALLTAQHRALIEDDGSNRVTFKWHWPRGTFDRRMSALEIAEFVLPHMPSVLPYLSGNPLVHAHFAELMNRLALWPREVLDEVLPWIRRLDFEEEDEILLLDIGATEEAGPATLAFDMGARA